MTREELIRKVALKMDEISSSTDVIVSVTAADNNPLYTQIDDLLDESINDVLMKAPVFRLDSQAKNAEELAVTPKKIFNESRVAAQFSAPDDFLRLVSITDEKHFQRPIVDFSVEGDDVDKRQHNRFLVARKAKPVAVIGGGNGKKTVTCYSYDAGDTPNLTVIYIPRYTGYGLPEEITLDGYLTDIVSWLCAGKVFAAQGDMGKGKICDDNAAALMI